MPLMIIVVRDCNEEAALLDIAEQFGRVQRGEILGVLTSYPLLIYSLQGPYSLRIPNRRQEEIIRFRTLLESMDSEGVFVTNHEIGFINMEPLESSNIITAYSPSHVTDPVPYPDSVAEPIPAYVNRVGILFD